MARSILLKFESMSAGADEEGKDLVGVCMCVCTCVRTRAQGKGSVSSNNSFSSSDRLPRF